jgi:hypothetical protein
MCIKMSHAGRKRRQSSDDGMARDQKEIPSVITDLPSPKVSKKRRRSPLAGKSLAVSTLSEVSDEVTPESYKKVIALCHKSGAKTTNQVHKRLFCVVATQAAVEGNTQRVRKAWKLGIPVVLLPWIIACERAGKFISIDGFVAPRKEVTKSERLQARAERESQNEVARSAEAGEGDWSTTVDLGCCCLCHESNAGVTECVWCVECSVNKQLRLQLSGNS